MKSGKIPAPYCKLLGKHRWNKYDIIAWLKTLKRHTMITNNIKSDSRKLIKKMFEDAINYPDMVEIIHDAVYMANSSQDEYYVVDYIFLPKEKNIELIMAKR